MSVVLEELFDTPIGKVAGGISALAGAFFCYRASYRLFTWIFSTYFFTYVSGVFGWLVTIAFAAVLIWLSRKLWSRWRLVFGATLAFSAIWSMAYTLPRVRYSEVYLGNNSLGWFNPTTIYANAIVLLTAAVVSLFWDRILAWWKPAQRANGDGQTPPPPPLPHR